MLAFALSSCASSKYNEQYYKNNLTDRAAFDFQCDKSNIQQTKIDENTVSVKACNKQATYVMQCESVPGIQLSGPPPCKWIMNTSATKTKD